MYRCSACGRPVVIIGTLKVRRCAHTDAPIIAEARAKMEGRGGLR